MRVVEGGSGYNNATVVDVDEPEFGDGVQAVQIAAGAVTVGAGGTITAIAPRNAANERGSGYGRPPALRPTVGSGAILVAEMDFVMIPDAVWQEDIAAGGIGLVSFGGYRTGAHS